jgi:hypothetical protein
MKIAINLFDQNFYVSKSLGILNVSLGLLKGLASVKNITQIHVLSNSLLSQFVIPEKNNIFYHRKTKSAPKGIKRIFWDQYLLTRMVNKLNVDWLILPKGFPPVFFWPKSKVCCYIHDNIFGYYQKQNFKSPPFLFENIYFSYMLKRALQKADLIVTNSKFTFNSLKTLYPQAPCRTLGIGFNVKKSQISDQAPKTNAKKGILFLTSKWPHKLTKQAIDWLQRWEKKYNNARRPIYGIGNLPKDVHWPDLLHWHHYQRLEHNKYQAIRKSCEILLYFSCYEGYGMPPVEAVLDGLKVLSSDIPPQREIFPSYILFNNKNYDDFEKKLNLILKDNTLPKIEVKSWEDIGTRLYQMLSN